MKPYGVGVLLDIGSFGIEQPCYIGSGTWLLPLPFFSCFLHNNIIIGLDSAIICLGGIVGPFKIVGICLGPIILWPIILWGDQLNYNNRPGPIKL